MPLYNVFFFKQKTAYDMRISDWSSDVCSSDLEREADMPAFAQTTVARLQADLDSLRQQGFKLAVIDTPPAITMAIQSVISVAALIVIPNRPRPPDLRAAGATVDLCERAGKPPLFVGHAATPRATITYEATNDP